MVAKVGRRGQHAICVCVFDVVTSCCFEHNMPAGSEKVGGIILLPRPEGLIEPPLWLEVICQKVIWISGEY